MKQNNPSYVIIIIIIPKKKNIREYNQVLIIMKIIIINQSITRLSRTLTEIIEIIAIIKALYKF